jgi:hypothetical protein
MPISEESIVTNHDNATTIAPSTSFYPERNKKSNDIDNKEMMTKTAIEEILKPFEEDSRKLILDCLKHKYGLDPALIVKYKDEFRNYLREVLGNEVVEVILSKINHQLTTISTAKGGEHDQSSASYLSSSSAASVAISKEQKRRRISNEIHFVICDTCFWCASLLRSPVNSLRCLACRNEIKSAVPIALNEKFSFEVDGKRGLSMFFWL